MLHNESQTQMRLMNYAIHEIPLQLQHRISVQ